MSAFYDKKCSLCEGGALPLSLAEANKLLKETPGWHIDKNGKMISKKYSFKGFYPTMSFINAVAFIAQQEGHHPDISFGYNYCHISFMTHAIDGLSENDFICAAKVNRLIDCGPQ